MWGRWSKKKDPVYLCEGGAQARLEAEERLRAAQQQREDVEHVSESLRVLREDNHFASRIENLIRGGHHE